MKKALVCSMLGLFILSSLAEAQTPPRPYQPAPIEIKEELPPEGPGPEPGGLPRFESVPGKAQPAKLAPGPRPERKIMVRKEPRMEFGISAGLLAGISGVLAEIRWNEPFDLPRIGLKYGAAYAQGEDINGTTRKHALLFLDAQISLAPRWSGSFRPYLGAGLNYDAYTTGRKSGGSAAQYYLGLEADLNPGSALYLELGCGGIKADFFPDYEGTQALLGYRSGL